MCLNSGQVVSVLYQQGEQVKWTRGISIVSAENRFSGQVYQYCISREQVKWTSGIKMWHWHQQFNLGEKKKNVVKEWYGTKTISDFVRHHECDQCQTLHDGTTHWALPVQTSFSNLDHISRSRQ